MNSTKSIFLLISILILSPFIIFLGKNSLQTEFFTTKYFWTTFLYCFIFFSISILIFIFFNRSLFFLLFFAYLSFLQFYFFDIRKFVWIFQYGNTGYYVLSLILIISLIATLISRFAIFRNFVLILLLLNLILSTIYLIPAIGKSLQVIFKNNDTLNNISIKTNSNQIKYPNIFYIVPDGLTSPKILKDYSNIDFQYSIENFEKLGFSVSEHNYSSYNLTYLSLASLFSMNYPVNQNSLKYKDRSSFYPTIRDYNPNLLKYLKQNNYKFVIVPPAWGGCPNSKEYRCIIPVSDNFFSHLFQDYAVSKMFQHSLIKRVFERYNNKNNIKRSDMNDGGKTLLDQMKINSNDWMEGGVFTMVHMMIPHVPYRDENCNITDHLIYPSNEGYKSSVHCAFKRIFELSEFIIKKFPDANIVVQADHGVYFDYEDEYFFENLSQSSIDSRLAIFTAVKGCNSEQASKLNQANIVRSIVECLINGPLDKKFINKSFFGFYEKSPEFGKVYNINQN